MRTPRSGKKITKSVHPALAHPDWSARRKLSASTMINSPIQITQAKKMNIVHMISRNGYDARRDIVRTFLEVCLDYGVRTDVTTSSDRGDPPPGSPAGSLK